MQLNSGPAWGQFDKREQAGAEAVFWGLLFQPDICAIAQPGML
jgi:hypothetical protein